MIAQRTIGNPGLPLSVLAFGSMRLLPGQMDRTQALALLLFLVDAGVTTFHTSAEYESFEHFCALMREVARSRPAVTLRYVVKIANPHFDVAEFSAARFSAQIEEYRQALQTGSIAAVQWLLRFRLADEPARLAILERDGAAIATAVEQAKAAGHIGSLIAFPYTRSMARAVMGQDWCDGLAVYLNPLETEYVDFLDDLSRLGKSCIGIRPLAAGRGLTQAPAESGTQPGRGENVMAVKDLIRWPLHHAAVKSVIISVSSIQHAQAAAEAVAGVSVN